MPDEMIIRHCAPTLAGMKTGNMFTYHFKDALELRETVRRLNTLLKGKGIRVLPLRYQKNCALIYLYRPSKLSKDLENDVARTILTECGYCVNSPKCLIRNLIARLNSCSDFPHEIGLFLGYPPEDVLGFIQNQARDYKCVGCWKVYGDEEKAKKTFEQYKKCTNTYCRCYMQGKSVERLTVAV